MNLIQKIINGEDLEEIYNQTIDNLFKIGPINTTDLEVLTYLCIYNRDFFESHLDKVLNFMGIFYKDLKFHSLEEVIFGQYRRFIQLKYNEYYTPVQSQILYNIDNSKCYSFSAPTSTGKSYAFLKKIKESKNDVVIIVPSRALINEYLTNLQEKIKDKTINILPFIDHINTNRSKRNVFIVTPERCRELFKYKDVFKIDLILFDEAQLSNEESTRGVLFDGIVRRCYKWFKDATFVFAHPFVKNPEAQLKKNNFDFSEDDFKQFTHKNVGQIFFFHDDAKSNFHHFGIDKKILGTKKTLIKSDPIKEVLAEGGSALFYVTKRSIKSNKIFEKFQAYIDLCTEYDNSVIDRYLSELIEYTGGNTDFNKDYYSKLISYLKRGIVIHHGSLPLKIRSILEHYTKEGLCRICFATSTLEQGVNMPFDLVYLNRLEGKNPLSVKNLIGRAGRSTSEYKFDYGFVVVKDMSKFRSIMNSEEVLEEKSLLDVEEDDKDYDYNDFKDAIINETFDDSLNLTLNQVERLNQNDIFVIVEELLDSIFINGELISLNELNKDIEEKHSLYSKFQDIYSYYIARDLTHAEQNVFNTAIKIIIWRVHGKTFKNICWYRYSYASQSNVRNQNKGKDLLDNLEAKFFTEYNEIPNKNLQPYNALSGVLAKNVDYDFIISDTYDYLDKLIGFKLTDVFFACLSKYHDEFKDPMAIKLSKLIKYGTDNERHIMLLRYGLTFEDIEILDTHINSVSEQEITFFQTIYSLPASIVESVKRYI